MSEESKKAGISRREFIGSAATAAAGLTLLPGRVEGGTRQPAPSDRLNVAGVGVGGMGRANLKNMPSENVVALCDVDWKYAQTCFDDFPNAKKYWDWRKMFDEMHDSIDAVVVATADHTHAIQLPDDSPAAPLPQKRYGPCQRLLVTRDDHLTGRIVIGDLHRLAGLIAGLLTSLFHFGVVHFKDSSHATRALLPGKLHEPAAFPNQAQSVG